MVFFCVCEFLVEVVVVVEIEGGESFIFLFVVVCVRFVVLCGQIVEYYDVVFFSLVLVIVFSVYKCYFENLKIFVQYYEDILKLKSFRFGGESRIYICFYFYS